MHSRPSQNKERTGESPCRQEFSFNGGIENPHPHGIVLLIRMCSTPQTSEVEKCLTDSQICTALQILEGKMFPLWLAGISCSLDDVCDRKERGTIKGRGTGNKGMLDLIPLQWRPYMWQS